jgi:hypothetical protein
MSRLYQITMSDGMAYITREKSEDEFYKQKFYEMKAGCLVVARDGQQITLYDLKKNNHVGLPTLLSSNIIRVQRVIKGSGLEALYLKTTSNIEVVKGGDNGS